MAREKKRCKYNKDLPKRMYAFFISYSDAGAPSFVKFARSVGATLDELEGFRIHKNFDRAWRECGEIRRDYLIDCALTKRHDSSFSKFLLGAEFDMQKEENTDSGNVAVTLEVLTE